MVASVCRLCLIEDETALNIFSNDGRATILGRIMTCTGLEISPGDGLPQKICVHCRFQLEEFCYFRKRCQNADRRLRRHRKLLSMGRLSNLYTFPDTDDECEDGEALEFAKTAKSELHVKWRAEALKAIQFDIESYKKDLENVCEQKLRIALEDRVRNHLQERYSEIRKESRVNMLDELFIELEKAFVRKRNEQIFGESYNNYSDSETFEGERTSSSVYHSESGNVNEANQNLNESVEVKIIDLTDQPNQTHDTVLKHISINGNNVIHPNIDASNLDTAPMVEINIASDHLNCSPSDILSELGTMSTPSPAVSKDNDSTSQPDNLSLKHRLRKKTDSKELEMFCKKHEIASKSERINQIILKSRKSCKHCKLRNKVTT